MIENFWSWQEEKCGRNVLYVPSMLRDIVDVNTFSVGLYFLNFISLTNPIMMNLKKKINYSILILVYLFRCGCNFCYMCGKFWEHGHLCNKPST
jgi:hypothetical protein